MIINENPNIQIQRERFNELKDAVMDLIYNKRGLAELQSQYRVLSQFLDSCPDFVFMGLILNIGMAVVILEGGERNILDPDKFI